MKIKMKRPKFTLIRHFAKQTGLIWDVWLMGWIFTLTAWITDFTMKRPYGAVFGVLAILCFMPLAVKMALDMRRINREYNQTIAEIDAEFARIQALFEQDLKRRKQAKPAGRELQEF